MEKGSSLTRENRRNCDELAEKVIADVVELSIDDKSQVTLLSATPASLQSLRFLDSKKTIRDIFKEEEEEELSPRAVLDNGSGNSESSETSSSKASTSYSTSQAASQWRGLFGLWKKKSLRRLSTFPAIGVPKLIRRRSNRESSHGLRADSNTDCDFCLFRPSWKNFSLSELKAATNNFSAENLIGKGGYAEVYKGCLEDGQLVAVKRLARGTAEERTSDFLSELGIIVHINHPNIAKLIGFGVEGGMHIVLQLSPHGSLASVLHDSKEKPGWSIRYKVAMGTAQGLEYLHEKCARRIIHRDIKAANILLIEDFKAQLCDFGLAKWLPHQWSHHNMPSFEGTFGYLAPEYIMHGIVNEKTDIFAFGVILLELITGRQAVDSSRQSLVMWAKPFLEKNDFKKLVDPSLCGAYNHAQLNRMASIAFQCLQHSTILRPKISQVLKHLKCEEEGVKPTEPSQRKILQRTFSEEINDAEEYNATKYLNDLRRHKQLALDL